MKRYSAEVGAPAKRSLRLHSLSKKPVAEILSGLCAQTFKVWGAADDSAKSVNRLYWGDTFPLTL